MTNPKITRRQIIKGAAVVGAIGALGIVIPKTPTFGKHSNRTLFHALHQADEG